MNQTQHGGEIFRAAQDLGIPFDEILDFSASINPLGMPEGVAEAAAGAVARAVHYPEVDAASLRRELAAFCKLPEAHLVPGSGSTELLYLLPRVLAPRRALIVTPAFSEYQRGLELAGCEVDGFALRAEDRFALDPEALLSSMAPMTDLVVVANPANPTGALIPPPVLLELARVLEGRASLLVDEAFIDFCPDYSILRRVPEYFNLYVLRSLTKFYAIPGLRAGFLAGPEAGVASLGARREPWTLSTPALAAASACLDAEAYRRLSLATIPQLRQEFADALVALGLEVFPSRANFVLARLPEGAPGGGEIAATLRRGGILVRTCCSFPPLDDRYLRLAVRSSEDNKRLVAALQGAMLKEGAGEG